MESTFEEVQLFSNVKKELFDPEENETQLKMANEEKLSVKEEEAVESFAAFNAHAFLSNEDFVKEEVQNDGVGEYGDVSGEIGQEDQGIPMENNTHMCPVDGCFMMFSSSGDLVNHMKEHSAPWLCVHCKSCFSCASNLRKHYMTHTGEKPFECDICMKAFTQASSLRRHEMIHTGERPFKCDLCEYKTSDSSNMKKHQLVHTDEKPSICDKPSSRKRKYSFERLFECGICGSTLTTNGSLKMHQRIHTEERSFFCTTCGLKVARFDNLSAHKKRLNH